MYLDVGVAFLTQVFTIAEAEGWRPTAKVLKVISDAASGNGGTKINEEPALSLVIPNFVSRARCLAN